ncbi:sigma-70 family RNA polymerase sigma factor [Planctomycetaceae bacterium SH139]
MTKEPQGESGEDDHTRIAKWVDAHADVMYRFARRRIADEHVIEDILQETFLAALKAGDRFRAEASVRTWLLAILRFKIIDYYRVRARLGRMPVEEDQTLHQLKEAFREQRLLEWNVSPSQTLENEEFWNTLMECLEKLPKTISRAFMLREVDDCSITDVCLLLGISRRNLAIRMFRARSSLRDCLELHWFGKD